MMGLFQGDSHGNGEWAAPLSANVVGVASVTRPLTGGCGGLYRDLFCTSRVSGWGSQAPRSPLRLSVSPSGAAHPGPQDSFICDPGWLPGTSGPTLAYSSLFSSRS